MIGEATHGGALVKGLKHPSVAQNETADKTESGSAIELDVY